MKNKSILKIADLSKAEIEKIFSRAKAFSKLKKYPSKLAKKTIMNVFFEDSTRTRISFDIAAKRLGAEVVNFTTLGSAVINKGETYKDTLLTLDAMGADLFVIRHVDEGAGELASELVEGPVINAGTGKDEHPTQALLDAFTILQKKGTLKNIKIAICGDLKHSRVAKSNINLLQQFGAIVHLISPRDLSMDKPPKGTKIFHDIDEGIKGCDVVMCLRIQKERFGKDEKLDTAVFNKKYGMNHQRLKLAKKDVIVMHPQPMNRGIEITDALADDLKYSVIRNQVTNGVFIRMACLDLILNG